MQSGPTKRPREVKEHEKGPAQAGAFPLRVNLDVLLDTV